MTDKKLIDMLRVGGEVDLKLAADRIEQLNKENDRLVDECDRLAFLALKRINPCELSKRDRKLWERYHKELYPEKYPESEAKDES